MAAAACLALPAAGQAPAPYAPARPALATGTDANDPRAYYLYGVATLARKPADAAAGFYWAARLQPGWPDALYGEYVARLLTNPDRLLYYLMGDGRTVRSAQVRSIDSLYVRARTMDPLLERPLDPQIFAAVLPANQLTGGFRNQPILHGWYSAGQRRYVEAVGAYRSALRGDRRSADPGIHAELGRIFFHLANYDSAAAELRQALADSRREEGESKDDSLVLFYRPKASLEYSVGVVELSRHDTATAREAFGRALEEDLSYYPAHIRLSALALAAGDTASALSELDLAVEIRGDEPALRMRYGMLLADAMRYDDALKQFEKARELNPDYAAPYFVIARMYDGSGMREEAIAQYRAWLARAAQTEAQIGPVRERIVALTSELAAANAAAAQTASPPL